MYERVQRGPPTAAAQPRRHPPRTVLRLLPALHGSDPMAAYRPGGMYAYLRVQPHRQTPVSNVAPTHTTPRSASVASTVSSVAHLTAIMATRVRLTAEATAMVAGSALWCRVIASAMTAASSSHTVPMWTMVSSVHGMMDESAAPGSSIWLRSRVLWNTRPQPTQVRQSGTRRRGRGDGTH